MKREVKLNTELNFATSVIISQSASVDGVDRIILTLKDEERAIFVAFSQKEFRHFLSEGEIYLQFMDAQDEKESEID